MINLKEHKVFVEELNMEMVPLKIAEEAVEKERIKKLDELKEANKVSKKKSKKK